MKYDHVCSGNKWCVYGCRFQYCVLSYLIAEQRQDGYATDRASKPVELPPVKKEINKVNLQFTAPFENDEQVEKS